MKLKKPLNIKVVLEFPKSSIQCFRRSDRDRLSRLCLAYVRLGVRGGRLYVSVVLNSNRTVGGSYGS